MTREDETTAGFRRAAAMLAAATPTAADWLRFAERIRAATPTVHDLARALAKKTEMPEGQ